MISVHEDYVLATAKGVVSLTSIVLTVVVLIVEVDPARVFGAGKEAAAAPDTCQDNPERDEAGAPR
jgi:hypothetical protein